ncbi:LOW QUALITY PROTEIN: oxidoreductase YncB [Bacillus sp. JCM 19047]|nr:LOW QUALITY PROTEIN: oxidoreductase YncB [Bacillus sp. JCM 19047]
MKQQQIRLRERPDGWPSEETFSYEEVEVKEPTQDEVTLKTRYLSVDPYMRGRMNDTKSYVEPFQIGEPLNGGIVAEVTKTKSEKLKVGDIVSGALNWQEYNTVPADTVRKLDLHGAPMSTALGVLGMPGLTAYFGMYHIGEPKEGETVVVSGAAGAVGPLQGNLNEKVHMLWALLVQRKSRYIRSIGFDEAIDYKEKHVGQALEQACPNGIDVYFENVGGEISDQVWPLLNSFARVPVCGAISSYNLEQGEEDIGRRVQGYLVKARVKMQGFLVGDFQSHYKEAYADLSRYLQNDELQFEETIHEGFDKVPEAFLGLFKGKNIGKQLVKVEK